MEAFQYQALDSAGRTVSGVVQADTARQARSQLRAQGLLPSTIGPVRARERARQRWARAIKPAELSLVTRQLATLLGSGLTMEQSLNALIESANEPLTRETLTGVKSEVTAGLSLAGALGVYEKSFPDFYRALVHGGEESGALPVVLQHLADYLDARQAMKQKTGLALLYPILVTIVALSIVTGLLVYVVPQVVQVFQQSRQSLPLLTRALIAVSDGLRAAWPYLAALIIGGAFGARAALRRDANRRRWHAFLLGLPWLGPLIRGTNTSRFASTLAITTGSGVPILRALETSRDTLSYVAMRQLVEQASDSVREGASLARSLSAQKHFPPMLVHMIRAGEITGELPAMLDRAASAQESDLERRTLTIAGLLEPMLILAMGVVVLLIVLAVLMPIIEINQLVR